MKFIIFFLTIVLLISCSEKSLSKTDDSTKPVVEIPLISNQTEESNPYPANETVVTNLEKFPPFPTPEEEDMKEFLKKENRILLRSFGLQDLEKQPIANDDIEVRVWQIFDLFVPTYKDLGVKKSVFILNRTNGNWSARVFRDTINQKSGIEKKIRTKLNVPQSGWENIWQNLIDKELLTFPDSVGDQVIFDVDAGTLIIQSKVRGVYRTFQYSGGQKSEAVRYTAQIVNIVADEFDLEDFQATRKYEE